MRLQHYTDSYYCDFDPITGNVDPQTVEEIDYTKSFEERMQKATDIGYCSDKMVGWIALYATEQGLIVQIDRQKWCLTDDTVNVWYHYKTYDDDIFKTMCFRIEGPEEKFETSYEIWWNIRDELYVDPIYASLNPDNEDNDLFAYIDRLKNHDGNPEMLLKNLIQQGKRAHKI